jgi:hypothetical protein
MTYSEFIAVTKDVILASVGIMGAFVAVKGLNTWKRQLKGQSEYELARRILVSIFKYRDAILNVRHPAMWAYEMPSPSLDEEKDMTQEQLRFYGTSKAYQARWDKVQTERTSLYPDLLESEAIWGDELKKLFKELFKLESELFTCVQNYVTLINPDTDKSYKKAIMEIKSKRRDILYDDLSVNGDDYKKEFQSHIDKIEKYLKPKLIH